MAKKITIDGKQYDLESLNELARRQLGNLRVVDARIAQLEQEIGIAKTARSAYARVLAENLPKESA